MMVGIGRALGFCGGGVGEWCWGEGEGERGPGGGAASSLFLLVRYGRGSVHHSVGALGIPSMSKTKGGGRFMEA